MSLQRKQSRINFGEVRIIGGVLRHRKLIFPAIPELRPTPNRVRETLFNWLSPYIEGASCLDLFAGSGALGFEAISRGAKSCVSLEANSILVDAMCENKNRLDVQQLEIIHAQFPYDNFPPSQKFSIVFVDPPFHQGYVSRVLHWLKSSHCLTENAIIYVESERREDVFVDLADDFVIVKDKVAGQVRHSLLTQSPLPRVELPSP